MHDVLAKPQPTLSLALFSIVVVGFGLTIGVGYIDSVIFDQYVKPDMIDENWIAVGTPYWDILTGIVLFSAGGFAVFLLAMRKLAGAKTNGMLFLVSGLEFLTGIILYYTGWIDYLYYKLRSLPIPNELDWLDHIGLFTITKNFTGTSVTESTDLYITMAIGLFVLVGMWAVMIHHHKKGTLKRLGLI